MGGWVGGCVRGGSLGPPVVLLNIFPQPSLFDNGGSVVVIDYVRGIFSEPFWLSHFGSFRGVGHSLFWHTFAFLHRGAPRGGLPAPLDPGPSALGERVFRSFSEFFGVLRSSSEFFGVLRGVLRSPKNSEELPEELRRTPKNCPLPGHKGPSLVPTHRLNFHRWVRKGVSLGGP